MPTLRACASESFGPSERGAVRSIFDAAWTDRPFTDEDWDHMVPGLHFLLKVEGHIVSHGAVVERELHAGDHVLRTGYVENVATHPELQRRGYGTEVMRAITEHIARTYALGALDTGSPGFYERLGWRRWRGPTYVRTEGGLVRTAEEDGNVLVLLTPMSPPLDLDALISCEFRPGDVW